MRIEYWQDFLRKHKQEENRSLFSGLSSWGVN